MGSGFSIVQNKRECRELQQGDFLMIAAGEKLGIAAAVKVLASAAGARLVDGSRRENLADYSGRDRKAFAPGERLGDGAR